MLSRCIQMYLIKIWTAVPAVITVFFCDSAKSLQEKADAVS
jgi:hypothetical protein